MRFLNLVALLSFIFAFTSVRAEEREASSGPSSCSEMELWDYAMSMCMPRAMAGMPMKMAMLSYNAFFTQTVESGPRGRSAFTVPDSLMLDAGTSVGDRHYLDLNWMGTFERWTFPDRGYPELLQVGEENESHEKFLDAQHPHSSPVMGLTLSDTISLGSGKDSFKIWFAPRGATSEGPVAFMHRPSGEVNPDAPLGHHIGQDVGHIASTVAGFSIHKGESTLEVSAFNGTEPEPMKVDLPIGALNSYSARAIQQFTPDFYAMASAAFVKNPEPTEPALDHVWRYSGSIYNDFRFENGWLVHNALIYGLVNFYDETAALNSFAEDFLFRKEADDLWGRVEVLQRTPAELQIAASDVNDPKWVTALTLGYTRRVVNFELNDLSVGASVTKDILPEEFRPSYGGDPLAAKIFVRVSGLKMWDL